MNIFYALSYFFQISYLHKLVDSLYLWILPAILLLSYIAINLIVNRKSYFNVLSKKTPFLLLFICLIIGLIRSNNPEEKEFSSYIKIVQLMLLLFATSINIDNNKIRINSIFIFVILPFTFFALLNLLLWSIKYHSIEVEEISMGSAVLLSNLGVVIDRVVFPLGFGVNNYGTLIGAILILAINSFIFLKNFKVVHSVVIATCFLTLLLLDSRASLISSVLITAICIYIYKSNSISIIKLIPYIALFGPVLYMVAIPLLSQSTMMSGIVRNSEELATGNSRFFIWGIALNELSNFKVEHIFGYGEYGHFKSGASLIWSSFFGDYEKNELKSPHNTILSIVFDYGYVGLILYIYFLVDVSRKITNVWLLNSKLGIVFAGFYFYLVLIGITEATFGLYILQFNYLFYTVTLSLYTVQNLLTRQIQWKRNVITSTEKEVVY